jgi:hypothetical protein
MWEANSPKVGIGESNGCIKPRELLLDLEYLGITKIVGISPSFTIRVSPRGYSAGYHMDSGGFLPYIIGAMGLLSDGYPFP